MLTMHTGVVARRELLELWRDRRAVVSASFLAILLLVSVIATSSDQCVVASARADAQRLARQQWEQQKAKNPHSAAHFGAYAFKAPDALARLDPGVDPYLGVAIWVEAHRQNQSLYRPAQEHGASLRFGALTPALVLQDLLPLLLLALTVPAVSGPRESGLLQQELAAGVRGRDLVLGRAAAISAILVPIVAPAAAAATWLAWRAAPDGLAAEVLARCLLWLGLHGCYGLGVLALGLLLSARARTVRAAWLLAAGIWVGGTVLAPRALGDLAAQRYPTPTATDLWAAVDRDMTLGVDGHDASSARTKALEREVLERYGVSRLEDLPVNFAGLALQAGEEHGNAVFDRHYGRLWDQYARQDALVRWASLILPVTALRSVSMALADTGVDAHRRFTSDVERYRRSVNKQMNDALAYRSQGQVAYLGDAELWRSVARFEQRPAALATIVRERAVDMLIVILWTTLLIGAALVAAVRTRA